MNTGDDKLPEAVREYFAAMGRKGGRVTGESKRRGDADYYSQLAKRRKPKVKEEGP